MKHAIVIPIMGSLHGLKSFWGLLTSVTSEADIVVIDNGAKPFNDPTSPQYEKTEEFLTRFVKPNCNGNFFYFPQDDNLGLVESLQWGYEHLEYDILTYIHNDLFIYKKGWDNAVRDVFETIDEAGVVGCFGSEGVFQGGGRLHVWNNMLEAEYHGQRMKGSDIKKVAVLDGMMLSMNTKMLDVRGGVDRSFKVHHFYDIDICLESIDRGFHNYIIGIPVHHQSGVTACNPPFQEWSNRKEGVDRAEYNVYYLGNQEHFDQKWGNRLPYHIKSGWNK